LHSSGYRVEQHTVDAVEVFGRPYRLSEPFACALLYDAKGLLWMSDTPQERIMMANNSQRSWGHVLVGGLGLGLYPQYAEIGSIGEAVRFTVVERSSIVAEIVEPTLGSALSVPLEIRIGDVETFLSGPVVTCYDTIFLDTWETLDAAHLPRVNRLRDLALRHLSAEGRVLLWGYRWMVRLFEDACRRLLALPAERMRSWLAEKAGSSTQAAALLTPVVDHFAAKPAGDGESALRWCRRHIVRRTV